MRKYKFEVQVCKTVVVEADDVAEARERLIEHTEDYVDFDDAGISCGEEIK